MKPVKRIALCVLVFLLTMIIGMTVSAEVAADDVARIGENGYATLAEAVTAANEMVVADDEMVEIVLLKDFYIEEKITISNNVTISGNHTIYRSNTYLGQMFSVPSGAKVTFKDITIDGRNNWTWNRAKLETDIQSMRPVYGGGYTAYVTLEAGAPVSTGQILGVGGEVVLEGVSLQNHAGVNLLWVGGSGTLQINNTRIVHNTRSSGGIIGGVDAGGHMIINAGTEISDNFAGDGNGGLANIYGKATINGGEIHGNAALNCNGYVFMIIYSGSICEMNGGKIYDNFCTQGWSNGYNGAFYVYGNGSTFIMNGGSIVDNWSTVLPAIANNGSNATIVLNGGTLGNSFSYANASGKDLYALCSVSIANTVNMESSRYYANLSNTGTLNGEVWFFTNTKTYNGGGTINGNVTVTNGAHTTLESGTWNGVVTVNINSGLKIKADGVITGGPVRVLTAVASGNPENVEETAAAKADAYIQEAGATVNVPVYYYHRLKDDQKSAIVVTLDYAGGLDSYGWSGIQRTGTGTEYDPAPLPQLTRDGYIFDGWAIADVQSANSMDISATERYVEGTAVTESIRLIAQWKRDGEPEEYTVTYEYSGEVPEGAPTIPGIESYEAGEDVVLPILELDGYIFEWDLSVLDDGKMPEENVTITGTWTPILPTVYTLRYEYDGEVPEGAPTIPDIELYEAGEEVILPEVEFEGYLFVWDTSVLEDGKMPEGDVTITGTWTLIENGPEEEIPDTGDTSNMMLWVTLLAVSGLLGACLFRNRKEN